jgi:hypothetical protein
MRTISNNQQITFWLNGVESYNTKVEPQIMQVPYYLPANIADELRVQVKDTVMSTYRLRAIDCNGNVLGTLSFTSTLVGSEYVYDILTTFGSLGVVEDMKVRLEIITSLFTASISGGLIEPAHFISGNITSVDVTFDISGGLAEPSHSLEGGLVSNVVSGLFYFGDSAVDTCSADSVLLYYKSTDGLVPGTTLHSDIELSGPAEYPNFVRWGTSVYNFAFGVIGSDTGFDC